MNRHTAEKREKRRKLNAVMFHTGCIGFGGGTALIPVIEEEAVENNRLINENDYNKDVVVANITPGALPVEIAAGIGRQVAGLRGMIMAALLIALPGTFLTVAVVSLISTSGSGLLRQILFASTGVTAYIIFMLTEYARGTWKECRINRNARSGMFFMAVVFLVTGGSELFQIFGIEKTPLFDVSTVNILALTFFVIFYTNGKINRRNAAVSIIIVGLYLLCVGKAHLIPYDEVRVVLQLLMVILAVKGLIRNVRGRWRLSFLSFERMIKEEIAWAVMLAVLSLPAFLLCGNSFLFIGKGLLSTILSFGGGDAYLAIADGMFVHTGMVSYSDFYYKIAAAANALPGSILCKVLAGVGYSIGAEQGGMTAGFAVALCGFACSVAGSGATMSAVMYIYERFENLATFHMIKIYIRPIVAGLLLSVTVSMLYQNMGIARQEHWSVIPVLLLTGGLYALNVWWKRCGRIRPIFMVLLSAALSLGICNGFSLLF